MISIQGLTKEFKKYTVHCDSIKSLFLRWKEYKKNTSNIEVLRAIDQLNLEIQESEVLCITGPNGAGKSTLAKLIAGTIQPTHGKIHVKGRIVPFLELGVAFNNELTGEDNLYLNGVLLGLRLGYLRKNKDKIFEFAGLSEFWNTPLKYYSSGMQLRLAFSIAMHAKGDVYLFDEILAVGDTAFQKKCFESFENLLNNKKTIIIISHDLEFIKKQATRVLVLTKTSHHIINDVKDIAHVEDIDSLVGFCLQGN
jgi:ABC-2 type transport system ATP-binding protein